MSTSKEIRCAVYTRKSVDEGLDQETNSLTVQREAAEAYITSQTGEGWVCLGSHYDDGGYSGGNMQRPALSRLLADIQSGLVDCVVVYKVDRLSRSLMDFAKLSDQFEQHGVSFVSVTQQINTGTSLGKLMLGILISFAQFERETIAERTRDRMASARRKGRWIGGSPFLGYDIAPEGRALVVNETEAAQVRDIFQLYLERESLSQTVAELKSRGLSMKCWLSAAGRKVGGREFSKSSLHGLLTNVGYIGRVSYRGEEYSAAHEPIVSLKLFEQVQQCLKQQDQNKGQRTRNKHGALLRGLLVCRHCGVAMSHSFTKKASGKVFRYYVCQKAMKESWASCPTKSVPAGEIEDFIVARIEALGKDAALQQEVVEAFLARQSKTESELQEQIRRFEREQSRLQGLVKEAINDKATPARFAWLEEQTLANETAWSEARKQWEHLQSGRLGESEIAQALSLFQPVWANLSTLERCDLLTHLIEQVSYDGPAQEVEILWKETGIHALLEE